jgi:hypothetical protein
LRAAAALRHELVEFGLVLGVAQAVEKFLELALLFFQPAQRLGAVLVKCPVAARGRPCIPSAARISASVLLPVPRPAPHEASQAPASDEKPQYN